MDNEANLEIAKALGWRVWQDLRPGRDSWFQERDSATMPGNIEVLHVPNYMAMLRDHLKDDHPELLPLPCSQADRT
jgi:hypothetical protein